MKKHCQFKPEVLRSITVRGTFWLAWKILNFYDIFIINCGCVKIIEVFSAKLSERRPCPRRRGIMASPNRTKSLLKWFISSHKVKQDNRKTYWYVISFRMSRLTPSKPKNWSFWSKIQKQEIIQLKHDQNRTRNCPFSPA